MRWRQFCAELLAACDDLGGQLVVTLGALLADTPHTRPIPVTGTATEPELVDRLKLEQSTYEGPTGIVGVFQDACVAARHPGGVLLGRRPALRRAAALPEGHARAARPARGPARGRASRSATCPRTPAPGSAASTSWPRRTRTSPTTSGPSRRPATPPSCPRPPARRSPASSSATSSAAATSRLTVALVEAVRASAGRGSRSTRTAADRLHRGSRRVCRSARRPRRVTTTRRSPGLATRRSVLDQRRTLRARARGRRRAALDLHRPRPGRWCRRGRRSPRVAATQASTAAHGARGVEVVGQRGQDLGRRPAPPGRRRRSESARRQWAEGVDGVPELGVDPLPVGAVVVAQQRQPDRHRVDVAVAQRRDEDQVAARLRHLLAVVRRPSRRGCRPARTALAGRPPARGRRTSRGAGRPGRCRRPGRRTSTPRCSLRDRRALDVPAGAAGPERALPATARPSRRPRQTTQSSGSFLPGRSGSPPRSGKISSIVVAVAVRTPAPNAGSAVTEK